MLRKKEMIAMLLAGGQGSRLGVLTEKMAKPAVQFGGKYRIIDFPLSNCINSGVDTVGVLTQYEPLRLNVHIGTGIPWDFDRMSGGVTILSPYERSKNSDWYTGTANAIYQNISFIEGYDPEYVLILGGDHIYKMDYGLMLNYHKAKRADITMAAIPVPMEEAHRFGVLVTDRETGRITEFEEKPAHPKSNLASMGIYIFNWKVLKEALIANRDVESLDFGMHVIPYCHEKGGNVFCYEFNNYWKDVGTLESYWSANMELIDLVPAFNLYEDYWKIYTNNDITAPQYIDFGAAVERCIISEQASIYGEVRNSVIGPGVVVESGARVYDSILMGHVSIGKNAEVYKAIIGEDTVIGEGVKLGVGEYRPNSYNPKVYDSDLVTIGERSFVPDHVSVGKNTAISGRTEEADYPNGYLESGSVILKSGGQL